MAAGLRYYHKPAVYELIIITIKGEVMQGKPIIHISKCRMEFPNISRRQERIHLDPMSGEDRSRSYVRCGEWTHLHPGQRGCTSILGMPGEDSKHTSIRVRRG